MDQLFVAYINLDMKIGADSGPCDAIDFAVEVGGGVK